MTVQELVEQKEEYAKNFKGEFIAKCCTCSLETPVKALKRIAFYEDEIDLLCPGNDPTVPCLAEDFKLSIKRKD